MNWEGIEEWGKSGRNIGSGFEKIKLTIGAHMSSRYKTQSSRQNNGRPGWMEKEIQRQKKSSERHLQIT